MPLSRDTLGKNDRPQDVSTGFWCACLAVEQTLLLHTDFMERSTSDVDLLLEPEEDGGASRGRLNEAINSLRDSPPRTIAEFAAKLNAFNQTRDVLGEEDPRITQFAFSVLRDATTFAQLAASTGSTGGNGRSWIFPIRLPGQPGPVVRPDFAGFLGWPRRSQSLE